MRLTNGPLRLTFQVAVTDYRTLVRFWVFPLRWGEDCENTVLCGISFFTLVGNEKRFLMVSYSPPIHGFDCSCCCCCYCGGGGGGGSLEEKRAMGSRRTIPFFTQILSHLYCWVIEIEPSRPIQKVLLVYIGSSCGYKRLLHKLVLKIYLTPKHCLCINLWEESSEVLL